RSVPGCEPGQPKLVAGEYTAQVTLAGVEGATSDVVRLTYTVPEPTGSPSPSGSASGSASPSGSPSAGVKDKGGEQGCGSGRAHAPMSSACRSGQGAEDRAASADGLDHPGGNARDQRACGHVTGDDRAGGDDRSRADGHALGDDGGRADPDVVLDHDRGADGVLAPLVQRQRVPAGDETDARSDHDVVPDGDATAVHERASLVDEGVLPERRGEPVLRVEGRVDRHRLRQRTAEHNRE